VKTQDFSTLRCFSVHLRWCFNFYTHLARNYGRGVSSEDPQVGLKTEPFQSFGELLLQTKEFSGYMKNCHTKSTLAEESN